MKLLRNTVQSIKQAVKNPKRTLKVAVGEAKRGAGKVKQNLEYAAAFPGETVNKGIEATIKHPVAAGGAIIGNASTPIGLAMGGVPGTIMAATPVTEIGAGAEAILRKKVPAYKKATEYAANKYHNSTIRKKIGTGVDAAVNYARMFSEPEERDFSWLSGIAKTVSKEAKGAVSGAKAFYKDPGGVVADAAGDAIRHPVKAATNAVSQAINPLPVGSIPGTSKVGSFLEDKVFPTKGARLKQALRAGKFERSNAYKNIYNGVNKAANFVSGLGGGSMQAYPMLA